MTRYGRFNLLAVAGLPAAACLAALGVFGPRADTLATVAGMNLLVRPASAQTLLTTEDGDRRVVPGRVDEPRIMHAVLRREQPAAEAQAPAAPAAAQPPRNAKRAARRAGSHKQSAATTKTTTKAAATKARASARGDGAASTSSKRPARRANKRT